MNVMTNPKLMEFSNDDLIAELVHRCIPGRLMRIFGTVHLSDNTLVGMEARITPIKYDSTTTNKNI